MFHSNPLTIMPAARVDKIRLKMTSSIGSLAGRLSPIMVRLSTCIPCVVLVLLGVFFSPAYSLKISPFTSKVVKLDDSQSQYVLPPLPFPTDALEPYIDQQTMQVHHSKHHQAYTDKLNLALKKLGRQDATLEGTIVELGDYLEHVDSYLILNI